jgi:hypothetical protein
MVIHFYSNLFIETGRNIRLLSAQANITMNSIQLHGDKSYIFHD